MNLQEAVAEATWEDVISFVEGLPDDVDFFAGHISMICPVARYLADKIGQPDCIAVSFTNAFRKSEPKNPFSSSDENVMLTPVLLNFVSLHTKLVPDMVRDNKMKEKFLITARRKENQIG